MRNDALYRGRRKFDLYVPQRRPTQDDRQDHRSHAGMDGDRIKYSPTSANVREKP